MCAEVNQWTFISWVTCKHEIFKDLTCSQLCFLQIRSEGALEEAPQPPEAPQAAGRMFAAASDQSGFL